MFQCIRHVFVPTYTATAGQKNQKRTGEMSMSFDVSRFLKLKICRDVECGDLGLTWPDKLRLPSFEEVDSAVKRLETQRLNF